MGLNRKYHERERESISQREWQKPNNRRERECVYVRERERESDRECEIAASSFNLIVTITQTIGVTQI